VAGAPGSPAVVSNGKVKLYIPNSASGLTVTSNKAGTVTVSNGDPSHSVTLPGGSVTISGGGVNSVGGAPGVQVVSHPNGDFVAATTGPKKPAPASGTVTGGPAPMTPKDRSRFLSKLDEAINAMHRAHLPKPT